MRTATLVPLADIAKRMKTHPRIARSKLRRALRAGKAVPELAGDGERWVFKKTDVKRVENIIRA